MDEYNEIDDVESLRSALQDILEEAEINDVEVEGSLRVQGRADHPDWEIQIWQIE